MGNLVKITRLFLAFLVGTSMLTGQELSKFHFERPALGTTVAITCYASDSLNAALVSKVAFGILDSFNLIFSDYNPESEIMRVERRPKEWIPVSDPLFDLIEKAKKIGVQTEGNFNIGIGALTSLWRPRLAKNEVLTKREVRRGKIKSDLANLHLSTDDQQVKFAVEGMRLDFGGIAKGYIGDHMGSAMEQHGLSSYLIDLGGDLVAGAAPPNEKGWKITIPWCEKIICIANRAVATSGPDFQFFVYKGQRYAHIIDPKTGWGVTNYFGTTVIAETGWEADALASAFSIMPLNKTQVMTDHSPVEAIIGVNEKFFCSKMFSSYLIDR